MLLVVIGVLAVVVLLLFGRSRRSGGDPSMSVQAFNRALTAMEPGSGGPPASEPQGHAGEDVEGHPDESADGLVDEPAGDPLEERGRSNG
jgi:hypothetical protein